MRDLSESKPLFDSLETCRIERCGIDADCEDCGRDKICPCENWQDEKGDGND